MAAAMAVAIALGVAGWAPAARTQEADLDAARRRFEGTWRLTTDPARARRVIDRAVERAVRSMSFFVRPIARPRLREATPVTRRLRLAFSDEGRRLTVSFDDDDRYTTRLGVTSRRYRSHEGEQLRITQRLRPSGQLEQVFQTDSGTRWYVWIPRAPDRVRIEATTQGEMMPDPMVYALEYER
jgi:hypothetical protein